VTGGSGYEVVVVGAGLAGAAACLALRRAGLAPLWIGVPEAATGPKIGEALAPAGADILARLGAGDLLDDPRHRESNETLSAWGSGTLVERNAIVHLQGPGHVLDRAGFERDLTDRARNAVDHRPLRLAQSRAEGGEWQLNLSDGSEAEARFLIDASGRHAVVGRRQAGLQRDDQLVAACAFLDQTDESVEPTRATLIEAAADGWWYAALLADGRLSLSYYSDPDQLPRGVSQDVRVFRDLIADTRYIGRWIADAGFSLTAAPEMHSAGTTWLSQVAGTTEGAGWAAIGDAAAAFDPLSSHGMTTALWAGERMGQVVAGWLADPDGPGLDAYDAAVQAGVSQFRRDRARLYAREVRFAERTFWSRRRPFPEVGADTAVTV